MDDDVEHSVAFRIVEVSASGSAFGKRLDNGELVFLSATAGMRLRPVIGETFVGNVRLNYPEHAHNAPFFAVFARRATGAQAPAYCPLDVDDQTLTAVLLDALARVGRPIGTMGITRVVHGLLADQDDLVAARRRIGTLLDALHDEGRVMRADVYRRGSQDEDPVGALYGVTDAFRGAIERDEVAA